MGLVPMPKSVEILKDGEDQNREKGEAKASSVCGQPLLCWMCYIFIMRKVVV